MAPEPTPPPPPPPWHLSDLDTKRCLHWLEPRDVIAASEASTHWHHLATHDYIWRLTRAHLEGASGVAVHARSAKVLNRARKYGVPIPREEKRGAAATTAATAAATAAAVNGTPPSLPWLDVYRLTILTETGGLEWEEEDWEDEWDAYQDSYSGGRVRGKVASKKNKSKNRTRQIFANMNVGVGVRRW